jgi:hypothetical protein
MVQAVISPGHEKLVETEKYIAHAPTHRKSYTQAKSNQAKLPAPSLVVDISRVVSSRDRQGLNVYSRFMAGSSATHAQIGMFEGESCKVDSDVSGTIE